MTIYVDSAIHRTGPRGRKRYCHMTADTVEELHAFARFLGVKRCWFETSRSGTKHYDIDEATREIALSMGAIEKRRRTE